MADYSHILFNKSPSQLRLIGARGGKAHGRKQRAHRSLIALMPKPPQAGPLRPHQTTAEAVAMLEAQFPWLRCPEKRRSVSVLRNPRPSSAGATGTNDGTCFRRSAGLECPQQV